MLNEKNWSCLNTSFILICFVVSKNSRYTKRTRKIDRERERERENERDDRLRTELVSEQIEGRLDKYTHRQYTLGSIVFFIYAWGPCGVLCVYVYLIFKHNLAFNHLLDNIIHTHKCAQYNQTNEKLAKAGKLNLARQLIFGSSKLHGLNWQTTFILKTHSHPKLVTAILNLLFRLIYYIPRHNNVLESCIVYSDQSAVYTNMSMARHTGAPTHTPICKHMSCYPGDTRCEKCCKQRSINNWTGHAEP